LKAPSSLSVGECRIMKTDARQKSKGDTPHQSQQKTETCQKVAKFGRKTQFVMIGMWVFNGEGHLSWVEGEKPVIIMGFLEVLKNWGKRN